MVCHPLLSMFVRCALVEETCVFTYSTSQCGDPWQIQTWPGLHPVVILRNSLLIQVFFPQRLLYIMKSKKMEYCVRRLDEQSSLPRLTWSNIFLADSPSM